MRTHQGCGGRMLIEPDKMVVCEQCGADYGWLVKLPLKITVVPKLDPVVWSAWNRIEVALRLVELMTT